MIHTVAGPFPPERLGHCQPHEHLFIRAGYPRTVHPPLRLGDLELTVRELQAYRAAGSGWNTTPSAGPAATATGRRSSSFEDVIRRLMRANPPRALRTRPIGRGGAT